MMFDLFRLATAALLGWRWVVLVDLNGSMRVRRAKFKNGQWSAERMGGLVGAGIRTVALLNNGRVKNGCYVTSWHPHKPFQRPSPFPNYGAAH